MRPFFLISALLIFGSPAVAQNWQEYSYPDYSFRVTFPAKPQVEATTYRVTGDRKIEAVVYFVRRDNAEFKVTVAELADAGLEPTAVIDYAIKALAEGGEVKVNLPHHIMSVFGRRNQSRDDGRKDAWPSYPSGRQRSPSRSDFNADWPDVPRSLWQRLLN